MKRIFIAMALCGLVGFGGCGSDQTDDLPDSIVFLQRMPRTGGMGDIFQYTSYLPGAKLVKLSPPTADGDLTVLCCDDMGPEYAEIDIGSYDLSFDAREIVMSARLSGDQRYGLFVLSLDSGEIEQLPTDPNRDYIYPIFMPGDRIFFMSNAVVEEGAPQFRDEYNRGVTTQPGTINRDGTDETLGARNLSHRVFPTMLSDGRVMYTQWDHLAEMNAGHLVISNPDMTNVREAFGKEGTGVTNSYLKAVEIAPGRVIAIGTARERTFQAGSLLDIRLGEAFEQGGELHANRDMSEANASYRLLTPQVPLGMDPSSPSVGRYYDAYPLDAAEKPRLLVSWADGWVESGSAEAADEPPDFGIYLYDSERQARRPIFNSDYWDINPRPLVPRDAPPKIEASGSNQFSDKAVLIGSMNVYDSSLDEFPPGSVYGVRVIEGFSTEEGVPNDFGITEHEGAALLGVSEVRSDGSWAALIPANVPVHVQAVDHYALSLRNEPVWFSGNAGESRFCGGCHEDRAKTTVIQPGITEAIAIGPDDLRSQVGRFDRVSDDFSRDEVVGVPWDVALQDIFDRNCTSCHDGTPGPANPSWTIVDPETGDSQEWVFDLRGNEVEYGVGEVLLSGYTASHLSLMGPDMMELEDAGLVIEGDVPVYVKTADARDSALIQKLNPPRQYPTPDMNDRAFETTPHGQEQGFALTADEYYLLILMADMGGQFYSRENAPGSQY